MTDATQASYEIRGWRIEDDDFYPDGQVLATAQTPEEAERRRSEFATRGYDWQKVWIVSCGALAKERV